MGKLGGVMLVGLGVIMFLFSAFRLLVALLALLGGELSSYQVGVAIGGSLFSFLVAFIGYRALKLGLSLMRPPTKPESSDSIRE